MENTIKLDGFIEFIEGNEAQASVSLNPLYSWAKIVVTDDQKNLNNQRIPEDEFQNIINTGINAPVKMAEKTISMGHAEAWGKPIGTIAQLRKIENRVEALAALWKRERPQEINLLKEMYNSGKHPNVSWEVSYADSIKEDDGTEVLHGVILNGLAVVGMPAYAGRTAFVSMSAHGENWNKEYIESLPDENFVYVEPGVDESDSEKKRYFPYKNLQGELDVMHLNIALAEVPNLDLSEDIKNQISGFINDKLNSITEEKTNVELKELEDRVAQLEADLQATKETLISRETELETLKAEKEVLAQFKDTVEKDKAIAEKLLSIKNKFKEAGLEKDETYFNDNKDKLLNMDEGTLDFMLQEMVAFASVKKESKSSHLPPVDTETRTLSPVELAEALRKRNSK